MTIEVSKLKPMNNDVILRHIPRVESSIIHIEENPSEQDVQRFVVEAVSNSVTSVVVGETVCLSWTRVTSPIDALKDGKKIKIGITDEKEILYVIDGYDEDNDEII